MLRYVASLNIEYAYYERMKQYEAFEGLCFVDTLDMAEAQQIGFFTLANTERVEWKKKAAIMIIIGNPPHNVGQKSENDENKNRKYKEVDQKIRDTYTKDSRVTSKSKLDDSYVKFFRWAAGRLGDRDGIVCFVSNNGFVDRVAFDGMRKVRANGAEPLSSSTSSPATPPPPVPCPPRPICLARKEPDSGPDVPGSFQYAGPFQ